MTSRHRRFFFVFGVLLCCAAPSGSSARGIHDCVTGSDALDFTNPGGALVVPVKINGKDAGAFFSTLNTRTTVWDAKGFHFDQQAPVSTTSLAGDGDVYTTTVDSLTIGQTTITDLSALIGGEKAFVTPAGLPLMIDIGWDLLHGFDILIDRHSDKVVIFSYDTAADCPEIGTLMHDTGPPIPMIQSPDEAPQADDLHATLEGRDIKMTLDTSANRTIIRQALARKLGVTRGELAQDDQIRVGAGAVFLGHRHRFREFRIGSHVFQNITLDVVPNASFNVLGMDILRHFNVLIDGQGSKLWLEPYTPPLGTQEDKALPWSPLHDRLIITKVRDEKPAVATDTPPSPVPSGGPQPVPPLPKSH